jgi:hypothetical protein
VAQYCHQTASENHQKEGETVYRHYTDILLKENGKWSFIAWAGGDDPKKEPAPFPRRGAPSFMARSRRGCSR